MAKKSSAAATAKPTAQPAASASIDDIFASKPKPKSKSTSTPLPPVSSTNAIASSSKTTEAPKKKKKKVNAIPAFIPDEPTSAAATEVEPVRKSKKAKTMSSGGEAEAPRRVVEEVIDPSVARPAVQVHAPPALVGSAPKGSKKSGKRKEAAAEDDEMFADSRGTGPRRKTEEGFLIYKEAELKIDPEAGGTPLCPFDCECCF